MIVARSLDRRSCTRKWRGTRARESTVSASVIPVGCRRRRRLTNKVGSGVIRPTFAAAAEYAIGILVVDLLVLRIVARMFNRERLVTGAKATR